MKEEIVKKTTATLLDTTSNNYKKVKRNCQFNNVSSTIRNSKKMKYLSVGGQRESYTFARKKYAKKILYV